jgi:DNA-binding MarR family transcriptional regulator
MPGGQTMKSDIVLGNTAQLEKMNPKMLLTGYMNEFNNKFQLVGDYLFDDISWKQMFVLTCIPLFSQAPTIKDIGDLLGSSHQNTKQLLIRLEENGYVEMDRDNTDKRKIRVRLTRKAKCIGGKIAKRSDELMDSLFEGVSREELEATASLFMKLDENLSSFGK